jgi:hypothetical protein
VGRWCAARIGGDSVEVRSHRDLTVANDIELHRALDLLRIRSVSFALIASLGCLAERSLGCLLRCRLINIDLPRRALAGTCPR